jgi:hypothetical protein
VIDPSIKIPQSMLPPLAAGETEATRRTLSLDTTQGTIDVDLFVLGDADTKRSADVLLKSTSGPITANLVRPHAPHVRANLTQTLSMRRIFARQ